MRIEHLALSDLLAVCVFLGGYAQNKASKPTKVANLDHAPVAMSIVQAAGDALIDWPTGYHELLRRIGETSGANESCASLARRFGYFYTALYKRFCGRQFEFLRTEFDSFVHKEWVGQLAKRNRRLSNTTRLEHQWLPLTTAAKQLRVKRHAVCSLISRGVLKGQIYKTASGRTRGTVCRGSLEAYSAEKDQWMTLTDVRKVLRLSRKHAYALLHSGELKPIGGPSVDGASVWKFSATDVHALASQTQEVILASVEAGR